MRERHNMTVGAYQALKAQLETNARLEIEALERKLELTKEYYSEIFSRMGIIGPKL